MKAFFKEFKEFISAGNLIELAVAFILGLAIKAVVDAFINERRSTRSSARSSASRTSTTSLTITVREGQSTRRSSASAPS